MQKVNGMEQLLHSCFILQIFNQFITPGHFLRNLNRQNPSCMKRLLVIVLLVACMAAVAFASLSTRKQKDGVQKMEKKEVKEKKVKKSGCWLST
jgi:hypothetical protein